MQTLEQVQQAVAWAMLMYNEVRPHQELGVDADIDSSKWCTQTTIPSVEEKSEITPKLYTKMNSRQRT